jgi:outer membrane protein OmpA-like peptidoglycan-associated protein
MKLRYALIAATVLSIPIAAKAQPVDGLYVGLGAGYNYLQDTKIKSLSSPYGSTKDLDGAKLSGNGGFAGLGSVGYGFGNGFRVEVEGNYRQNDMSFRPKSIDGVGVNGGANLQTFGGFVNALFDFDVGAGWVYPYIGAGVGYEGVNVHNGKVYVDGTTNGVYLNNNTEGALAAQGIVGAAFPIDDVPGLSITAEYRFIGDFGDSSYSGNVNVGNRSVPVSAKLGNMYTHEALIGLRYAFGVTPEAPPPPPAPMAAPVVAPAPAPARTYLVFFDWDRADLSARARQIISEAAQNVARVQVTRIEVAGHADRSGTPAYNQKLSLRRAQTVAAELVRLGVAQNEIDIEAFGDTHPLVPTAAGVREPQNRRVEIVLK